jgi:dihydroorotate dehydrogenase
MIGVNVGANKDSADRIADYVAGVRRWPGRALSDDQHQLAQHAGAAGLQDEGALDELLRRSQEARDRTSRSSSRSRPTSARAIPSGSSAPRSITRSTRSSSPTRRCRGRR